MAPVEIVDESHVWRETCEFRAARERLIATMTRIADGRWYEMTTGLDSPWASKVISRS